MSVLTDGIGKNHGQIVLRHAAIKTANITMCAAQHLIVIKTDHCIWNSDEANCNGLTDGSIWTRSLSTAECHIVLSGLRPPPQRHCVLALLTLIHCQLRLGVRCRNSATSFLGPPQSTQRSGVKKGSAGGDMLSRVHFRDGTNVAVIPTARTNDSWGFPNR
jgi:hypothetical protein